MTAHTLRAMASGGMYDQIGGGFARYSVDARWLVPHFEKMLYDNALLARAYLHGWQVTGEPLFRDRLRGDARLGAARDARRRGRLLLRARRRLRGRGGQVLRLVARRAARGGRRRGRRGVRRDRGRATSRARTSSSAPARHSPELKRRLYEVRSQRVWPGLDDKRLTSWNALMIARARRGRRRARAATDYLDAARGVRGVHPARAARRGRPAAADVEGRPGEAERLPRGPRVPARGAADALRGDLRAALVRRGARARRHDDRAVRRRGARRLLRDVIRPRAARGAAQGPRGPPDPVGQLERRLRPAAPGRADRRARVREARGRRVPPAPHGRRLAIRRRSRTCSRRSTSTSRP